MAAVSNWMHVDYFTLDQAAALWCDCDPSQIKSFDLPPEVVATRQMLISGLLGQEIKPNAELGTFSRALNYSDMQVSRIELEKFARTKKLFPAFLFDTLAPFEKPESAMDRLTRSSPKVNPWSQTAQPVKQGGRPPEYDWDSFMLEIIRRANMPDGLPAAQAELVRDMLQWFRNKFDLEPAESSVKLRTSKIYKYLSEMKAKAKNPQA